MGNGENLTARIVSDARAEAEGIVSAASREAEESVARARAEAAAAGKAVIAEAERKAAAIAENAKSGAARVRAGVLLAARREEIDLACRRLLELLDSCPVEEYFSLLERLVLKAATGEPGVLVMSPEDAGRVPPGFSERLAGRGIAVEPGDVAGGGFVLRYGDIEINCLFPALLEERRAAVEDAVRGVLFA